MARIEQKVRTLVSEDAEMETVIETILDRADETGEVKWVDVREDISSGQWGRLIEKGILIDGETGFRLDDPEATRDALEDETVTASSSDGESSWSKWDKGAAVVSIGLFAGYSWAPMRNLIGSAMNVALGPLNSMLPFYAVVMILAVVTGLYSTILQANLMDSEKMGEYQAKMQEIQEKRKAAKERGDDEALDRIQDEQMEAMGDQMGMFKEQFRPMVWIMFLTIPVFLWMYWGVGIGANANPVFDLQPLVLPLVGEKAWTAQALGPIQVWIVWYFLCSMGFTQIIRKGLNIDISPTGS
ncbi:Uncharacterized membrane protein, DUF106 family [Haloplanus vescus]|uniref:Uncharacterized membrane protein, DUF106 family n=1 Tax=Haloplanus vescus TaxID=555874 RepID=A0A1H4AJ77_9EURY|nr:DUF106 domain-containing protein [Haloplanus vescus]SEA35841.1 Uncharacterized membrane protein, DUF106 family [Haloplanus vescus]